MQPQGSDGEQRKPVTKNTSCITHLHKVQKAANLIHRDRVQRCIFPQGCTHWGQGPSEALALCWESSYCDLSHAHRDLWSCITYFIDVNLHSLDANFITIFKKYNSHSPSGFRFTLGELGSSEDNEESRRWNSCSEPLCLPSRWLQVKGALKAKAQLCRSLPPCISVSSPSPFSLSRSLRPLSLQCPTTLYSSQTFANNPSIISPQINQSERALSFPRGHITVSRISQVGADACHGRVLWYIFPDGIMLLPFCSNEIDRQSHCACRPIRTLHYFLLICFCLYHSLWEITE